jgi:hypothetical protein
VRMTSDTTFICDIYAGTVLYCVVVCTVEEAWIDTRERCLSQGDCVSLYVSCLFFLSLQFVYAVVYDYKLFSYFCFAVTIVEAC